MSKLEKKSAGIITVLLHPVFMPLAGFLIILYSGTYPGTLNKEVKYFLIAIVSGTTLIMPLTFIPVFLHMKSVRNLSMHSRRERIMPFYITLVCYLFAFVILKNLPVNNLYINFMIGICLTLLLVIIISLFWKISIHTAGLGGMVALILYMSFRFNSDMMLYLVIALFLSGICSFARLAAGEHTPSQVYAGFFLGLATIAASLMV